MQSSPIASKTSPIGQNQQESRFLFILLPAGQTIQRAPFQKGTLSGQGLHVPFENTGVFLGQVHVFVTMLYPFGYWHGVHSSKVEFHSRGSLQLMHSPFLFK